MIEFLRRVLAALANPVGATAASLDRGLVDPVAEDNADNISTDNPYFTDGQVYATGFIYTVIENAMLGLWPMALTEHPEVVETAQNIVQGVWKTFTDENVDGDYGVLYEVCRLFESNIDPEFIQVPMLADSFTSTIDLGVTIEDLMDAILDDDYDEAMHVAMIADSKFEIDGYAEGCGVQALSALLLVITARSWARVNWPEFADANVFEGEDDD